MKAEEYELIRKAQAGDLAARNRLIEMNYTFIAFAVRKALGSTLARRPGVADEYMSFGVEAYCKAIQRFRPEVGCVLTSFASKAIFHEIYRAKSRSFHAGAIATPTRSKSTTAARNDRTALLHARARAALSIDAAPDGRHDRGRSGGRSGGFASVFVTDQGKDPRERAERAELLATLRDRLDSMEEREREIMRRRTLEEGLESIGADIGLTKERVRQIQLKTGGLLQAALEGDPEVADLLDRHLVEVGSVRSIEYLAGKDIPFRERIAAFVYWRPREFLIRRTRIPTERRGPQAVVERVGWVWDEMRDRAVKDSLTTQESAALHGAPPPAPPEEP